LCDFTTPPKDKFLLLVSINCGLLFFVINSEINQFKKDSPDLLESQVPLGRKTHQFLKHDSWIDCSKVIRNFGAAEVFQQINSKLGSMKGLVTNEVRKKIRTTVNDSRTLENRFKTVILEELTDC
jgi:hypothetical protein